MFEPGVIVCPLCRGSGTWKSRNNISELSPSRVNGGQCGRCGGRGRIIDPAYLEQQREDQARAASEIERRETELERAAFNLMDRYHSAMEKHERQAAVNALLATQDLGRRTSYARNHLEFIAEQDQEFCRLIVASFLRREVGPYDNQDWKRDTIHRIGKRAQIALVDLLDAAEVSVFQACDHLRVVGAAAAERLCSLLQLPRGSLPLGPLFPVQPRPAEFSLQEKAEIVRALARQDKAVAETFGTLGRIFEEESARFGGWLSRRLHSDRDRVELCTAVVETLREVGLDHEWTQRVLAKTKVCPRPVRKVARQAADLRRAMESLSNRLTDHSWTVKLAMDDGNEPWLWRCEFHEDGNVTGSLQSPAFAALGQGAQAMEGKYELDGRFLLLDLMMLKGKFRLEAVTAEEVVGSFGNISITLVASKQARGSRASVPSTAVPIPSRPSELTGEDLAKLPTRAVIRLVVEVHERLRALHPERFFDETRDQRQRVCEIVTALKQFSLGEPLTVLESQYQQIKELKQECRGLASALLLGYMTGATDVDTYRKKLDETVEFLNQLRGESISIYDTFLETAKDPGWDEGRDIELNCPPSGELSDRPLEDLCRDLPHWAEVALCVKLAKLIHNFLVDEAVLSAREQHRLAEALETLERNCDQASRTAASDQQLSGARSLVKGAKQSVKRRTELAENAFEGIWLAIRAVQCSFTDAPTFGENTAELYHKAELVLGGQAIRRCVNGLSLALQRMDACADSNEMLSRILQDDPSALY